MKTIIGDKYIYYRMALQLTRDNKYGRAEVGEDNRMVGGQNFYRRFKFLAKGGHDNQAILIEYKNSRSFAEFSRVLEVLNYDTGRPMFRPYINEYGEDCYAKWTH